MDNQLIRRVISNLFVNWKLSSLTLLATVLTLSTIWVLNDYKAWLTLGTGGTPPTPTGYLHMTKLRLYFALTQTTSNKNDPRDPTSLSQTGPSHLNPSTLPQRLGPRPKIIPRTMPQRQVPVPLDPSIHKRLHALPHLFAKKFPSILHIDKSAVEGRSIDALYTRTQTLPDQQPGRGQGRDPSAVDPILGNEIAHVHRAENSAHVWLSERDARTVIEKGWGERFPLGVLGRVHAGLTFVYAPRSMEEVDVVERIFGAGVAYLTGEVS